MLFRLTPTNRKRNPPLSALISILESLHRLSRNSFGIVVFSARQSEPELRLNHPDSPVIGTRQEMVFWKMGGLSDRPSRRMRGRNGVPRKYPEITDAENSSKIPCLLDDHVVDIEVSLHKQPRLVNRPTILSDRDRLILSVHLNDHDLLVRPLCYPDLLDPCWR